MKPKPSAVSPSMRSLQRFSCAAAGAALFAAATSEGVLILARAMIGLGFAGGLMASFKAVAQFAPPGRIPLLNSWVMAFGGVGVYATTPDELSRAVNEAMDSGRPTLVNAIIDEKAGTESGRIGNLNPQSAVSKKA